MLYVNELVLLVHTKAPTQPPRKTYIEKHLPGQWRSAIGRFEVEFPPLALCASHWKADQLLSEMSHARKPGVVDAEVKTHTNASSSGSKRKQGNSGTQIVVNNKQKLSAIDKRSQTANTRTTTTTGNRYPIINPSSPIRSQACLLNQWISPPLKSLLGLTVKQKLDVVSSILLSFSKSSY